MKKNACRKSQPAGAVSSRGVRLEDFIFRDSGLYFLPFGFAAVIHFDNFSILIEFNDFGVPIRALIGEPEK